MKTRDASLVYSTEQGRVCPECRRPVAECGCHLEPATPIHPGPVRVYLETKGRRGKVVTVVSGAPLAAPELEALGKQLRQKCGAGGSVKDGVVEIQGDHCATVAAALQHHGWKVKT